ncbi:MAG: hypothetical protein NZ529_00150 [Cytophagaceae bacterium]|nr:hypothetical protein [Cytophagaceae bacterium]MDW8455175.1 hypothetical protein [Cytophagaceae bacterium]
MISEPFHLANLYDLPIYLLPEPKKTFANTSQATDKTALINIDWLMLLNNDQDFSNPEIKNFLDKLTLAIKADKSKTIILSANTTTWGNITSQYSFKYVLAFGVVPSYFALKNIPANYHAYPQNDFTLIACDPATALLNNKDLKNKLWNCLKSLLSL